MAPARRGGTDPHVTRVGAVIAQSLVALRSGNDAAIRALYGGAKASRELTKIIAVVAHHVRKGPGGKKIMVRPSKGPRDAGALILSRQPGHVFVTIAEQEKAVLRRCQELVRKGIRRRGLAMALNRMLLLPPLSGRDDFPFVVAALQVARVDRQSRVVPDDLVKAITRVGGDLLMDTAARVDGAVRSRAPVNTIAVTWPLTKTVDSQGNVVVESKEEGSPIEWLYDDVSVRSGGVLYLATGEYKVRRFEVASGGKIVVDSRRGPVRVQVRELLKLGGSESAVDAGVPRLILRYDGRNDVLIHAPFAGALFAPHAAVSLSGEGRASGPSFASVFADTIVIGRGEVVRPLPLEWHTAAVLGVSFRNP